MDLAPRVENCTTRTKASRIALVDNANKRVKAEILNEKREQFRKVRFDNCIVAQETAADFLLIRPSTEDILIVELKGGNVEHAIRQLEQTFFFISNFENRRFFGMGKIGALVVCTQYPHGSHAQVLQNRFFQRHGVIVYVKTKAREYEFDSLLSKEAGLPLNGSGRRSRKRVSRQGSRNGVEQQT